jgi:hypothetical protein
VRLKNKGLYPRDILTLGGKLTLQRTLLVPADAESAVLLKESENARGVYPLDQFLKIDHAPFKTTYRMMAAIAKEGIKCTSYPRSAAEITEKYHFEISPAQVKRITDYVGRLAYLSDCERADSARETENQKIDRRKRRRRQNDVLYIEFDGSMVDTRVETEGSSWKECKIALAFSSANFHRWINHEGEECQALGKRDIVGIIGSVDDFRYHVLALAKRNDYDYCSEVVVITDGAKWIIPFVENLFPRATHILDKFHAKENASRFANAVKSGKNQKAAYAKKLNELIDAGDVDGLLKMTEAYKEWKSRNGILNFHTYVASHQKCMNYPEYEKKGYFVGSGAIESCHRYVMQNRMKQPGQRWNVDTGQGILSLKSRYESGNWNDILDICRLNYVELHMGSSA